MNKVAGHYYNYGALRYWLQTGFTYRSRNRFCPSWGTIVAGRKVYCLHSQVALKVDLMYFCLLGSCQTVVVRLIRQSEKRTLNRLPAATAPCIKGKAKVALLHAPILTSERCALSLSDKIFRQL